MWFFIWIFPSSARVGCRVRGVRGVDSIQATVSELKWVNVIAGLFAERAIIDVWRCGVFRTIIGVLGEILQGWIEIIGWNEGSERKRGRKEEGRGIEETRRDKMWI